MTDEALNIAGIEIPSSNPVFLAVVGVHVLLGLVCTITGILAMLSVKRSGRHPSFGSIYFWCLGGVFVTAAGLSAVRWVQDYDLFILGASAFAAAYLGRTARRKRWNNWVWFHIAGMGTGAAEDVFEAVNSGWMDLGVKGTEHVAGTTSARDVFAGAQKGARA
jgi:hypothetical protein